MKNYAKDKKTVVKKTDKKPRQRIVKEKAVDVPENEIEEIKDVDIKVVDVEKEVKVEDKIKEPIINEQTTEFNYEPLTNREPHVNDYAKVKVVGGTENVPDIPEEEIERPSINLTSGESNKGEDGEITDAEKTIDDIPDIEKKEPRPQGNKDLEDGSKKEKNKASEHLANTLIDGYDMAHNISLSFLSKTDEKLMKQAVKGKLDSKVIDSEIQVGNTVYPIRKLVFDYNNNLENVLVVSPEFKDEIRPLLKEELQKRDMGLTPMQRIATIMIKDLQPKIVQIVQLNSTMNAILKQQSQIIKDNESEISNQADGKTVIIEDTTEQEPEEKAQD